MPSNALSGKSFNTATPAICHKGPPPPIVPPPPLKQAIFFCFASLTHKGWPNAPIFAATANLHYNPSFDCWTGTSGGDTTHPSIKGILRIPDDESSYYLLVAYRWWPGGGLFVEWTNQQFSASRPYVGQTLTSHADYYNQLRTANLRETPG